MLRLENEAVARNEQLRILHSVYAEPIAYYKLNSDIRFVANSNKSVGGFTVTTRNYILNSRLL